MQAGYVQRAIFLIQQSSKTEGNQTESRAENQTENKRQIKKEKEQI